MSEVTRTLQAKADELIGLAGKQDRELALLLEADVFGASTGYSHERNYARCKWHIEQARRRANGIAPGRGNSLGERRRANQYGTYKKGEEGAG